MIDSESKNEKLQNFLHRKALEEDDKWAGNYWFGAVKTRLCSVVSSKFVTREVNCESKHSYACAVDNTSVNATTTNSTTTNPNMSEDFTTTTTHLTNNTTSTLSSAINNTNVDGIQKRCVLSPAKACYNFHEAPLTFDMTLKMENCSKESPFVSTGTLNGYQEVLDGFDIDRAWIPGPALWSWNGKCCFPYRYVNILCSFLL